MAQFILALDQGTTSSRSVLFDREARARAIAQQEFPQLFPSSGHVEHNPEAIWRTQIQTARAAFRQARVTPRQVAAIGIANQRETVVLWDRRSGTPVDNAYVWQSRISAPFCEQLKSQGLQEVFRAKTGLVIDPYFSGTKIRYLLDKHKLHAKARRGDVLAGTIDAYLLWRLTDGRVHATDYSNASRTLLYNIHTLEWDQELLDLVGVPREMLPSVGPSSGELGAVDKKHFGAETVVCGMAGDQQAATFGQGCFRRGMAKNTYGTGCFILLNTGETPIASTHGLLTTIGWGIGKKITYCLEGSVFMGGAVVQWLRDGLGILKTSRDVEKLARSVPDNGGVYFVPAMAGLGAPHWDPYARGLIIGIERGTTTGHIARAALEAMAHQSRDVIVAMEADSGVRLRQLRVDGGAVVNNDLMQFQADLLGRPVQRPAVNETTALGAAFLAGLGSGFWKTRDEAARHWTLDREFKPQMDRVCRRQMTANWNRAVERAKGWSRQDGAE